jgi:hypothetical protein
MRMIQPYVRISDAQATAEQLIAWGIAEKRAGSRLLIVDNMKHIRTTSKYNSLPELFRELSLKAKRLRDETKLPVIMLHHTNEDGDVSWSKDIKRDVDILITMTKDEDLSVTPAVPGDQAIDFVRFKIDKNRDGQAGLSVPVRFRKEIQTFVES